jgi:1-deoxy-D-xylulose-5-phosphate reductoisomerase
VSEVRRLVLTASGGPFRGWSRAKLQSVSREQALNHPTWKMGPKITIDSATLMNKGLEVIEASWLFQLPPSAIDVVVHPQSVMHSMVEFRDGSYVAQMGTADMRHPIQYALTWPARWEASSSRLDLLGVGPLTFEAPDLEAFPCLRLAYAALREGGDTPARLNAANEVAVARFLAGQLSFVEIPRVIEQTIAAESTRPVSELADLLDADRRARHTAQSLIDREISTR